MIAVNKNAIWFCPVLVALLLFAGCTAGRQSSVSSEGSFVEYKYDDSEGVNTYLADTSAEEVKYITKGDDLVRITPVKPYELAAAQAAEVLAPMDAEFKAAVTPKQLREFIAKYAPEELAFVAVQRLARPFIDARRWEDAAKTYNEFSDSFPRKFNYFINIMSHLVAPEDGVTISNLGGGINSVEGEYNPVISSDGKTLYYARDCGECAGGEEVYVANLNDDGNWGMARRFGQPLTTKGHEIPLGVSSDGNTLAVYGNYEGSFGRGDIFYIEKTQDGWGGLQHYAAPVNTENFESNAMYTADGKAMLFVSERPGGVGDFHKKDSYYHGSYGGNTDIYVYTEGQVINLGSTINTPYSEYSPYLHPDGKTLYFSSDGHPGFGGLDVYMVTRLSNTSWTAWSEPVNLGKEINTSYNDWGYQVAARGEKAYFAVSDRAASYGGSDIFTIGLPEKAKPVVGVITVSGTVTDPNGDALEADILWNELESQEEVGYASSDPLTGEYVIHLPSGGKYGYYAEKDGYMGESEHFDLKFTEQYKEYVMDIVLYPIEQPVEIAVEEVAEAVSITVVDIRMNNIFFEFNKADLQVESYMELDRWIKMLSNNLHIYLEVSGHADNVGTKPYNQKLSERRAAAVVKYLAKKGIAKERLKAFGFGETQPVATNDTEDGRQMNRRVQVKMINSTR